jgi:hypothetical protein
MSNERVAFWTAKVIKLEREGQNLFGQRIDYSLRPPRKMVQGARQRGKTYEIYLRGMPQRVGTAVGAGAGCSVWSLSVTASKCMDFEGTFPFQNRTLESE